MSIVLELGQAIQDKRDRNYGRMPAQIIATRDQYYELCRHPDFHKYASPPNGRSVEFCGIPLLAGRCDGDTNGPWFVYNSFRDCPVWSYTTEQPEREPVTVSGINISPVFNRVVFDKCLVQFDGGQVGMWKRVQ